MSGVEATKFSRHARQRQVQRGIFTDRVLRTIHGHRPTREAYKDDTGITEIYDGDTKVVVSEDNTVVTVMENDRNTRYDVTSRTKSREAALLNRLRQRPSDDVALTSLAELKLSGELGPVNATEAYDLLKRAADDKNSCTAMMMIARMYEEGLLKAPPVEEGELSESYPGETMYLHWMEKSAKAKNKNGMAFFGQSLCLKAAKMADSDYKTALKEKALYYLHEASRMNATRATYQIAEVYEHGFFGEKDLYKAMELYLRAAKIGSPASMEKMFMFSEKGIYDGVAFEELFDRVIKSWTSNSIGLAYKQGILTIEGDLGFIPIKGVHMLEMAAERGHLDAMKRVAKLYANWGHLKDGLRLAQYWNCRLFKLMTSSSEAGNLKSLWLLGKMHLKGKIGKFSLKEAETCLRTAADGMKKAEYFLKLAKLYKTGQLGNIDPAVGLDYLEKATAVIEKEGDNIDYLRLGYIYLKGSGFEQDFRKAQYWLEKTQTEEPDVYLHPRSPYYDIAAGTKIILTMSEPDFFDARLTCGRYWSRLRDDIKSQASSTDPQIRSNALRLLAQYEKNKGPLYHELLRDFNHSSSGQKLLKLYENEQIPLEFLETLQVWGNGLRGSLEQSAVEHLRALFMQHILSVDRSESLKVFLLFGGFHETPTNDHLKCLLDEYKDVKERALEELDREVEDLQYKETRDPSESGSYRPVSRILGNIYEADNQIDKAVKWYERSSGYNNCKASFYLGRIHERSGDFSQAVKWYTRGATLGSSDALNSLKRLRQNGKFTNKRFLQRFEHSSIIDERTIALTSPLYGLKEYPATPNDMYREAKRRLAWSDEQNKQHGVLWLREAVSKSPNVQHLNSSVELYRLYSTGRMGDRLKSIAKQHQLDVYRTIARRLNRKTTRDDLNSFLTALTVMPNSSCFRRLTKNTKKLLGKFKEQTITQRRSLDDYKFLMPF